jgi:hypothetical protein
LWYFVTQPLQTTVVPLNSSACWISIYLLKIKILPFGGGSKLVVMMVPQVCVNAQTHPDVYIKCVQYFKCHLHLNKAKVIVFSIPNITKVYFHTSEI